MTRCVVVECRRGRAPVKVSVYVRNDAPLPVVGEMVYLELNGVIVRRVRVLAVDAEARLYVIPVPVVMEEVG